MKSKSIKQLQIRKIYIQILIHIHPCQLAPVLNMIRFEDRDPTGFCNSEPDWTGFWKKLTGSDMHIQTALITAA